MAGKIQLDITTTAHIEGIEKARAGLKNLGKETMSFNQISKSGDMSALSLKMMENFRTTSLAKNETKAYTSYLGQLNRAYKEMVPLVQQGKAFTVDSDGSQRQIESLKELHKIFADLTGEVKTYAETYAQGVAKKKGLLGDEGFGSEKFLENTKRSGDAVKAFGTDLESVQYKMNMIKEQGTKMLMTGGYKEDSKEIVKLQDEYAKLTKEHEALSRAANGTGQRIKHLIWNFVSAQLIVFALRKAFSLLVGGIKESSQAAAEAEQVMQKFSTVFEGLDAAQQSVDRLTQSFGLASTSAKNIMATIGDMAYGLGASQQEAAEFAGMTAEFIQDLIAFKDIGGDVIEVTQSFMSGAAGNTRNFRKWGSIVKENTIAANLHKKGLDKLTGSELEWAKAQERVAVVMEQQKNAFGATEREWEMMLTVQRRYKEQTKQLKENIGETVNDALLPLKTQLLEIIEGWNKATEAKKNYSNNTPSTKPLYDLETDDGREAAKKSMQKMLSKMQGTYTIAGVTHGIDAEKIQAVARAYGVTANAVAELVINNYENNTELQKSLKLYDRFVAMKNPIDSLIAKSKDDIKLHRDFVQGVLQDISDMYKDMGSTSFLKQDPRQFVGAEDITYQHLVGADTTSSDQKAKMDTLMSMYKEFNNLVIKGGDTKALQDDLDAVTGKITQLNEERKKGTAPEGSDKLLADLEKQKKLLEEQLKNTGDVTLAKKALADVLEEILGLSTEINIVGLKEMTDISQKQIDTLLLKASLEAEYGKAQSNIVDLLMQKTEEEQKALDVKQDAIDAGAGEIAAKAEYDLLMEKIAKKYGIQINLAKELNDETREENRLKGEQTGASFLRDVQRTISGVGDQDAETQALEERNDLYKQMFDTQLEMSANGVDTAKWTEETTALINALYDKRLLTAKEIADLKKQTAIDDSNAFYESVRGTLELEKQTDAEREKSRLLAEMERQILTLEEADRSAYRLKTEKEINDLYTDRVNTAEELAEIARQSAFDSANLTGISFQGRIMSTISGIGEKDAETQALEEKNDLYRQMFTTQMEMSAKGMDTAKWTEETTALINKLYDKRIITAEQLAGLEKDKADEAERIAAAERATTEHLRVQEALLKARKETAGIYTSNQRAREGIASPFGESTQESALRKMNYAKQDAVTASKDLASSFLTDMQRQAVAASDVLTAEMMLSAEQIAEVTAYRAQLEEEAELEYQQALKDARDSSLGSIQAVWDSLGDVGMIRGWIDNFKNILEFEQSQGNEDATKTAVMGTLWGILGEFLGRLESVNELLSMVSSFMDMIGPVVDQFLAPLLVVLGPLLEMLADMILPVLEMLFPVIQVIAVVLISAIAVIKTFNAAVNWVAESIKVALWNMTHWFDKRNYPNLGAEIGEIWEDADEKVAKIWALEIDTRAEYVKDLTDAQKGEIDAYKQMYKDGLLSASETSALINKNVYGKTTDLVKTTDLSGSAGARSITYGDITINVPAGTDIDAEALAKLIVAEQGKQERRGA